MIAAVTMDDLQARYRVRRRARILRREWTERERAMLIRCSTMDRAVLINLAATMNRPLGEVQEAVWAMRRPAVEVVPRGRHVVQAIRASVQDGATLLVATKRVLGDALPRGGELL